MDITSQHADNTRSDFYFERSRLNNLFTEAVKYPLVFVCAGAGYGKTSAVHDYLEKYKADTVWIQLSEFDNISTRFWEHHVNAFAQINKPLAKAIEKFRFPDTA
ncbi:MAG: hypothetical protein FWD78_08705 [Treponema sp.]|nr:hypothetical protein [Treponema sp.]